jgi:hypothetical protein
MKLLRKALQVVPLVTLTLIHAACGGPAGTITVPGLDAAIVQLISDLAKRKPLSVKFEHDRDAKNPGNPCVSS